MEESLNDPDKRVNLRFAGMTIAGSEVERILRMNEE